MKKKLRIMMIGDIIGRCGRNLLKRELLSFRFKNNIDFIIANGENSAGGLGINKKTYRQMKEAGVDIITLGNHLWDKDEIDDIIEEKDIIRPLNYPCDSIGGQGFRIFENDDGEKFCVISLLGRVYMPKVSCPFNKIRNLVDNLIKSDIKTIIVDFHAEATSEKVAMGFFLDGKVSLIAGTHTHVQTNDDRILPNGTGYITDLGMTGDKDSVIGVDKDIIINKFLDQRPKRFNVTNNTPMLNGLISDIDIKSGQCTFIEKVNKVFKN
ncbi:MAG: TIGR00282 family metallophosphoesterase [Candidatus Muiribacteriota bacterium]